MVKYSKYRVIEKKSRDEIIKIVYDTLMDSIKDNTDIKPRGTIVIHGEQDFINGKSDYIHITFTEFASKEIVPVIPNDKLIYIDSGKWDMFTEEQNMDYETYMFEQIYAVDNIICWDLRDATVVGYDVGFGVNLVDDLDSIPHDKMYGLFSDDKSIGSVCVISIRISDSKPYRKYIRTISTYCDKCKSKIDEGEVEKGHDDRALYSGHALDIDINSLNYVYPGRLCCDCLKHFTNDIEEFLKKNGLKDSKDMKEREIREYEQAKGNRRYGGL